MYFGCFEGVVNGSESIVVVAEAVAVAVVAWVAMMLSNTNQ